MPICNYCKKCQTETPPGETCPRCGARLTKAGERLSFGRERSPVTDWFSWNAMLRIVVPVVGLVLVTTVAWEAVAEGAAGVSRVFLQGFFWTMLLAFGLLLLGTLTLLLLQGREMVRYTIDARGVHACVYLKDARPLRLYARLVSPQTAKALRAEAPKGLEAGLLPVRRMDVPWGQIRRVRYWPETGTLLFYRPRWWLALAVRSTPAEYAEAVAYVEKKLARKKGVLKRDHRRRTA